MTVRARVSRRVMVCHTDISVSPYMWYTRTPRSSRVRSRDLASALQCSPPMAKILRDLMEEILKIEIWCTLHK